MRHRLPPVAPRLLLLASAGWILLPSCSGQQMGGPSGATSVPIAVQARYCWEWGHARPTPRHAIRLQRDPNATASFRGQDGRLRKIPLAVIVQGANVEGLALEPWRQSRQLSLDVEKLPPIRRAAWSRVRNPSAFWSHHDEVCGPRHMPQWLSAVVVAVPAAAPTATPSQDASAQEPAPPAPVPSRPPLPPAERAKAMTALQEAKRRLAAVQRALATERHVRAADEAALQQCEAGLRQLGNGAEDTSQLKYQVWGKVTCKQGQDVCVFGDAMVTRGKATGTTPQFLRNTAFIVERPEPKDFVVPGAVVIARGLHFLGTTSMHNAFGATITGYRFGRRLPRNAARRAAELERRRGKLIQQCHRARKRLHELRRLEEAEADVEVEVESAEARLR